MSVYKKKYVGIGLIAVVVLVILLVQYNNANEKVYRLNQSRIDRLETMRKGLIAKKITNLNQIVSQKNQPVNTVKIIAHYTTNDCLPCTVGMQVGPAAAVVLAG